jgi:colanic acid biosynthesis glycosyl transferase WcaI
VRILFLTHYYPPELGAAPTRIAALAQGLAERGVDVTVHTGFPHYPSGVVTPPHRNRPLAIEYEQGPVRVVRSLVYPAPNRGFARRLADHATFAASALASASASGPVDVVIAESPPLFTAAAGVGYAACKRAALALNISDLWPESAIELGALRGDGRAAAAAHALARLCYRRSALITAPTAGIVATLAARPEAAGKVVQVPPAVDLERFASVAQLAPSLAARPRREGPEERTATNERTATGERTATNERTPTGERATTDFAPPPAPLRVLYAGTLGLAQGLSTLLEAAELAGPSIVELTIAGEGPEGEHLRAQIATRRLAHVRLLGSVSPREIPALYAAADAGIVPLRDLPIFAGALPTKLFEVLASGRPAIVAARGEAAALVGDAGAGLAVAPEDSRALAAAFRHLQSAPAEAGEMGVRGRAYARRFDRAAIVAQWHALLASL